MSKKRKIQVRGGCPEQRFVVLSDRGRKFTNTGCFKLMRWQPRLLGNAAVPTLGRTLGIAETGIQELELLKVSVVDRLLQLLSCNLSKSRNKAFIAPTIKFTFQARTLCQHIQIKSRENRLCCPNSLLVPSYTAMISRQP